MKLRIRWILLYAGVSFVFICLWFGWDGDFAILVHAAPLLVLAMLACIQGVKGNGEMRSAQQDRSQRPEPLDARLKKVIVHWILGAALAYLAYMLLVTAFTHYMRSKHPVILDQSIPQVRKGPCQPSADFCFWCREVPSFGAPYQNSESYNS